MVCSTKTPAFAARSGTMVYRLVTSQPSLSIFYVNYNLNFIIGTLWNECFFDVFFFFWSGKIYLPLCLCIDHHRMYRNWWVRISLCVNYVFTNYQNEWLNSFTSLFWINLQFVFWCLDWILIASSNLMISTSLSDKTFLKILSRDFFTYLPSARAWA